MSCQCFVSDAPEPFLPAAEKLNNTIIKLCRKGEFKPAYQWF